MPRQRLWWFLLLLLFLVGCRRSRWQAYPVVTIRVGKAMEVTRTSKAACPWL